MQLELLEAVGPGDPVEWPIVEAYSAEMYGRVEAIAKTEARSSGHDRRQEGTARSRGGDREASLAELGLDEDDADGTKAAKNAFRSIQKSVMRSRVVAEGVPSRRSRPHRRP